MQRAVKHDTFSSISAVAIRRVKPMFPSFNLAKDTGDSRVCYYMFNFSLIGEKTQTKNKITPHCHSWLEDDIYLLKES